MQDDGRDVPRSGGAHGAVEGDRPPHGDGRPAANGNGIFDTLTSYLLQGKQPPPGFAVGETAPAATAAADERSKEPERAAMEEPADARPAEEPSAPDAPPPAPAAPAGSTKSAFDGLSQSFVFRETEEKLVLEKELFVREEVVVSKLAEEHLHDVQDNVKRTEVEVERLTPQEAEAVAERPAPAAASFGQERTSRPERPAAERQAAAGAEVPERKAPAQEPAATRTNQYLWFVLLFLVAAVLAFSAGQMLGDLYAG